MISTVMCHAESDHAWVSRSFDLRSAYRQCAVHPESRQFSYIVVGDPNTSSLKAFRLKALPFGSVKSVHSFLRIAHSLWAILTPVFWVITTNYFDDFVSIADFREAASVDYTVKAVFRLLGWRFAEDGPKAPPFSSNLVALGVQFDVSRLHQGLVKVANTESRRDELAQALDQAVTSKSLAKLEALRLRGRMQFASGQFYGRLARRCLAVVTQHAYGSESSTLAEAAIHALSRFRDMLVNGVPRMISSKATTTWFIFTDASHEPHESEPFSGVGGVLVDQLGCRRRFFSERLSPDLLCDINVSRRKTIIYECEFFSVLCAMIDWKDFLHQCNVVIHTDNVFRDITADGNVWDQDSLVLPQHAEVLSKDSLLPLPSFFLAPDVGLKACPSRSSLTRSGSRSSFSSESSDGTFESALPDQVVLRSTGSERCVNRHEEEISASASRLLWLPMEQCKRRILDEVRLRQLRAELPLKCRMASVWRLLYSPEVHGVSIGTFFRQCQAWPGETLLLIEDSNGAVFGGFASHTWQAQSRYFGHPECFVFRFPPEDDRCEVFGSAGHNEYFLFADCSGLMMGGGRHPAIWIDQNFLKGTSILARNFRDLGKAAWIWSRMLISRYQIQTRKCYGHLGCSCFQSAGEANAETCALHAFSIILLFLQSPVSKGPCKTFGTTAALTPKLESGSESTGESLQFVDFVVRSFECWGFDSSKPEDPKNSNWTSKDERSLRNLPRLMARAEESDVCNAYAEQGGARHPAVEELVWRVWESQHRQHIRDPEFLVTAAPGTIQVLGRASGKENWALNGEYKLIGLHQGKVAYQKAGKFKHAISSWIARVVPETPTPASFQKSARGYWRVGDRWLIDLEGLRDVDICNAYADAQSTSYPGEIRLSWHIWDSTRQRHVLDSSLCTLVTPSCIEVVGRESPKENMAMNGSYHLVGLHAGQPAYMKDDGSGHAIRYWPREERWLIDLDGLFLGPGRQMARWPFFLIFEGFDIEICGRSMNIKHF
ncbi:unnamed protein product [Cladocopium goreaui]|uniref:Oxidation resistance protein 1 n=1 Tax=Cladocopium goreaui TaxID=2562237 RepID=A0A9P1CQE0_9DINO|nr:unnamed protein product [Cladocopium goreaui]